MSHDGLISARQACAKLHISYSKFKAMTSHFGIAPVADDRLPNGVLVRLYKWDDIKGMDHFAYVRHVDAKASAHGRYLAKTYSTRKRVDPAEPGAGGNGHSITKKDIANRLAALELQVSVLAGAVGKLLDALK